MVTLVSQDLVVVFVKNLDSLRFAPARGDGTGGKVCF